MWSRWTSSYFSKTSSSAGPTSPLAPGGLAEVRDEGCGVPAGALARIFERFARADAARTRAAAGVGLGLAIADAITKAHGGRCAARSDASGSCFSLILPHFAAAPASAPVGVLAV